MYLLDTNHCSRIMEADPVVLAQLQQRAEFPVAINVIVQGELAYMAQLSEHKAANIARVNLFLSSIRIYPVSSETALLYGNLKAKIIQRFGPKRRVNAGERIWRKSVLTIMIYG